MSGPNCSRSKESPVRRAWSAALGAVGLALALAPVAGADVAYIDHVAWVRWDGQPSLRVYPTPVARQLSGKPGTEQQAQIAWTEVLALAPDAGGPGMREQFICHWQFAELGAPGKSSWNLEPWRPVVAPDQMVLAGCNPGGAEEPF